MSIGKQKLYNFKFLQALNENEEHVRNELLNYVNYDVLKSQEKFSNALNSMDTEKIIQVLNTLHEQQKKKRGISNQQVCCNISDFMYLYHGVSSKFLDYYLALFYWIEKNKSRPYIDQAYDIITLLSNQAKKIPLNKFKDKPISFDLKGMLS